MHASVDSLSEEYVAILRGKLKHCRITILAQSLIENAAKCWISARHYKRPTIYRTTQETPAKSVETQTVATVNINVVEANEKTDKMLAAIDHENQFSENWITNFHFDDDSDLSEDTDIDDDIGDDDEENMEDVDN